MKRDSLRTEAVAPLVVADAPRSGDVDVVSDLRYLVDPAELERGLRLADQIEASIPARSRMRSSFLPICDGALASDGRSVAGTMEGLTHARVRLESLAPGHIGCACSCGKFRSSHQPCQHIVAFVLLFRPAILPWIPEGLHALTSLAEGRDARLTLPPASEAAPWLLDSADAAHLSAGAMPAAASADRASLQHAVYILRAGSASAPPHGLLRAWATRTTDGRIALTPFPPRTRPPAPLDDVDRAIDRIIGQLGGASVSTFEGNPRPSEADPAIAWWIAEPAARANRLHLERVDPSTGQRRLSPPLHWYGDAPCQSELHVTPDAPSDLPSSPIGSDPTPAAGLRFWLRVLPVGATPIDCIAPAEARFGNLIYAGNGLLDMDARYARSRQRFSDLEVELICDGPKRVAPPLVTSTLSELRYSYDVRGEPASEPLRRNVLDPRLGIRFFRATPTPILRLDGSPQRATVDVLPLARYRDHDDSTVIVDRDVRTHRLLEDSEHPLATVPCGDLAFEDDFRDEAWAVFRRAGGSGRTQWRLPRGKLPALLRAAAKRGWAVELQKQPARAGGRWSLSVSSGIDWLELDGHLDTPEGAVPLKELVRAARATPGAVEILPLADGTTVVVPEKLRGVLRKLARILQARESASIRFAQSEALLVSSLLESADRSRDDAAFRALRDRLNAIELPQKVDPHPSFVGTLRDYQQASLAWFAGLRELGMGGCLADEMGLGKTVQVLAMLAGEHGIAGTKSRRRTSADRAAPRRPSLLVVPRSIVRNWIEEAHRFVPTLRVADLSTSDRVIDETTLAAVDVAVITYGTLLRDIKSLGERDFHYVILDEAHAIKNETSRTTKAAKCLRAQHRLAITGTPIENHLGELWSLMEFLNPALAARLELLAGSGEPDDLATVRRAIRPFLLRRTKRDVARELPDRIEQTIHCGMSVRQQAHYDRLLKRIREDLLRGGPKEFGRSKLEVLEGLLRLRQVACHPCLVDHAQIDAGSGKLDALLPMLEESAVEGRKTLVFSQFTSFLAVVREELDRRGIVYEYLDGQTRDRAGRIRRFASDPLCSTFLLSLKAGGVGLNLQCAERVVLLDPWWNPAVEAQAIDRTHRIGQTRTVHAIRLVSAGTVEDRVLELQSRKRALAEAIVGGDAGPLATMTRDDLAFLLGPG